MLKVNTGGTLDIIKFAKVIERYIFHMKPYAFVSVFEPSQDPLPINFLSCIRMKIMKKLCMTTGWCPR